ncbi:asparagine synthase B [Candidatus Sulfidibacterium hydrothermale]|uniref:asparagine synthase B n=1 Tax=Candidatus Sulfidibacterium hydrothermale TaxID=2875962 RepID=UPI001F0ACFE8|nr:asparagine synthase B [Candidatus Sulfidibacterium hydrothermale]UBM62623.1 asparagine synthase B [Candidatus Sulfidibacterium hydrothermale]
MCSILGILDIKTGTAEWREQALEMSKTMRHRGPDWSGIYMNDEAILVHERLSIVDVENGAQPLRSADGRLALAVNGEIYNHRELEKNLKVPYDFQTKSDCEVINALYLEKGTGFLDDLNGIFAFVLYDNKDHSYLIGRDHIGIIPLYYGYDKMGNFCVASEMKALINHCVKIKEFPPGHFYSSKDRKFVRYYQRDWESYEAVKDNVTDKKQLKQALESAVHRQLMSDVPYGVLLSGGLDSSIIAAIVRKYAQRRIETSDLKEAWWPQVHSFSIGLEGSPDLEAAQKVADYIGSVHHSFVYTIQEGLDAVKDVIYHLETYDVTTIRAATPMYLMSRKIRSMGVKMVLSGEGADEVFGGYLYFHKAPDAKALHEETVRKLSQLHMFDCLRANKSMAAWGVEARVPFLDKEFLDVAMRINPEDKLVKEGKMEKQILRELFSDYLPKEVAWRQKEQFSDGVGYSWIDTLKEVAEKQVTDLELEKAAYRFPVNTPMTKEAYFYRSIFEHHFPGDEAAKCVPGGKSVACSTPEALMWDKSLNNVIDPSGRAVQKVHKKSY